MPKTTKTFREPQACESGPAANDSKRSKAA